MSTVPVTSGSLLGGTSVTGAESKVSGSGNGSGYVAAAQTVVDVANIWSQNGSDKEKVQATRDRVGLAVADYYTFGAASAFYGWANKQWGGTMEKIRKFDAKWNVGTRLITSLFGSDMWKTEGDRLNKLLKNGVEIPQELLGATTLTRGRSKEELIDQTVPLDFKGYKEDGSWVNNLFATSRQESNLQAEDIWGYSAFFEKFGNDWLGTMSESQRRDIATKALELGAVREHHGTIDISWTAELEEFVAIARTQNPY